jgi:hypothetical protein
MKHPEPDATRPRHTSVVCIPPDPETMKTRDTVRCTLKTFFLAECTLKSREDMACNRCSHLPCYSAKPTPCIQYIRYKQVQPNTWTLWMGSGGFFQYSCASWRIVHSFRFLQEHRTS